MTSQVRTSRATVLLYNPRLSVAFRRQWSMRVAELSAEIPMWSRVACGKGTMLRVVRDSEGSTTASEAAASVAQPTPDADAQHTELIQEHADAV